MDNQEEKLNYLEIVDKVSGVLGSKDDTEIENTLLDLVELKEYLGQVKEREEESINRENEQNEIIINLRKANNKLMRKVAVKDEEKEKVNEEVQRMDILDNLF